MFFSRQFRIAMPDFYLKWAVVADVDSRSSDRTLDWKRLSVVTQCFAWFEIISARLFFMILLNCDRVFFSQVIFFASPRLFCGLCM